MSVVAAGILAEPKNTVADMISRCGTFQAEVGATGDAVKAWDSIELTRWIIDESTLPPGGPFALVGCPPPARVVSQAARRLRDHDRR